MKNELVDCLIIILLVIISISLRIFYQLNSLMFEVLQLGLPCVFLLMRINKFLKKIIYFSLLIGSGLFIVFYLANIYSVWFVPSELPRLLGQVTVEETVFGVLWPLIIVSIYERFINGKSKLKLEVSSIFKIIISLWIVFTTGVLTGIYKKIILPYPYLILSIIFAVPPLILYSHLVPISKLLKIAIIFFALSFTWEILALETGMWIFAGQYVGTINFFHLAFPFEELLFWIILGAPTIVLIYERFTKK